MTPADLLIAGAFLVAFWAMAFRSVYIQQGMVVALKEADPNYDDDWAGPGIPGSYAALRHVRDYRERFPDGPLNAKWRNYVKAWFVWFAAVVIVFLLRI